MKLQLSLHKYSKVALVFKIWIMQEISTLFKGVESSKSPGSLNFTQAVILVCLARAGNGPVAHSSIACTVLVLEWVS